MELKTWNYLGKIFVGYLDKNDMDHCGELELDYDYEMKESKWAGRDGKKIVATPSKIVKIIWDTYPEHPKNWREIQEFLTKNLKEYVIDVHFDSGYREGCLDKWL